MAGNKVYVGDLGDNVEEEEIKQAFMAVGEVTEVELKSNFAFVHMADSNDVDEAISKLHQTEIGGKVVRVEKPRPRRPRGRGGMGGPGGGFGSRGNDCFNCGMSGHWQRECRRPPMGNGGAGMGAPGGYRAPYGGGGGGFGGGGYGMSGYGGGGRGGPPQGGRGGMMGGGPYNGGGGRGDGNGGGRPRGGPPGGGRGRGRGNCFRCNSPSHWSRECPQENGQQSDMNRFE